MFKNVNSYITSFTELYNSSHPAQLQQNPPRYNRVSSAVPLITPRSRLPSTTSTTSAISSITSKVSLRDTLDWHRNDNNGAESDDSENETESNSSCLAAGGSTTVKEISNTAKGLNNVDVQERNGDETASIIKRHRRVGKSRMRY